MAVSEYYEALVFEKSRLLSDTGLQDKEVCYDTVC